jgi:hypothetical protein
MRTMKSEQLSMAFADSPKGNHKLKATACAVRPCGEEA